MIERKQIRRKRIGEDGFSDEPLKWRWTQVHYQSPRQMSGLERAEEREWLKIILMLFIMAMLFVCLASKH